MNCLLIKHSLKQDCSWITDLKYRLIYAALERVIWRVVYLCDSVFFYCLLLWVITLWSVCIFYESLPSSFMSFRMFYCHIVFRDCVHCWEWPCRPNASCSTYLGPSIKDVHKKYVVLHSPMSAFGITPSRPRGRLHLRSSKLALDTKFHVNQASSYSQLTSSSHHQNLAASADESDTAVVSSMQRYLCIWTLHEASRSWGVTWCW